MERQPLTPWIETAPYPVRYAETDAMGVVYYANYYVWFEVARGAFCDRYGINYQQIEEDGTPLAVVDAYCRYKMPARFGMRVIARVQLTELGRSAMRFQYEILDSETRSLLAEGWTRHVWINQQGKPVSAPAGLKEKLNI
ncbi:MAG: acyl-CoA thioesterase [Fimbriimonadia bacterium]|nr:acyl-CoA thioesterase [Fimbriimonadia bacterium]